MSKKGSIENAIQITHVSKTFKGMENPALDTLNVSIRKGVITGLVGPDGAGKTTLIRLMTGLILPTTGKITIMGLNTDSAHIHDIIGYMPQKFGLYEDLSVIENLELYAELRGLFGSKKKDIVEEMLTLTSLRPFVDRLTGKLSGGMKQKLGLACALLSRPRVLLLDEPSVGVDPYSRRELWKMVQELTHAGMTVVWSTSSLDEADRCEEVLLFDKGKLLFYGPPEALSKRMEGRVFQVEVPLKDSKRALTALLDRSDVIEGVRQGNKIRIVCSSAVQDSSWTKVKPRFEDAFMDILGGSQKGKSVLAENMPRKKEGSSFPIKVQHLTKCFGNFTAAHDISFSIKQGEIFGLLGPNGAGKSTIFNTLCGLLHPTKGEALVSGDSLTTAPSIARSHIGYMAQKFSLYGSLSVKENLNFFSGVYGLRGQYRKEMIDLMVSIFDLHSYLTSKAGLLPLGYKQRLALACAVMHHPDVLFLDEPTSGVDPIVRREFWSHINGLAEKGVTIMITTHFLEEAEYCDRIALIYQGVNIATGTPDALKKMVETKDRPNPTLEDAFITLLEKNGVQ